MRVSSYLCMAAMTAASIHAVAAPVEPASDAKPTKFNVSQQTQIPGMTLQPGSYSIRVVDHLADRLIVRVDGPSGGAHSTFIGLPTSDLSKSGGGIIAFDSGPDGGAAARGFSFPGGKSVEFVYPKADAVTLAKANGTKVVAIDPASEGRVATEKGLSRDDMEVVTLWTLSSTKVGPGDAAPAISAAKYKAPKSAAPPANTQVASVSQDAPSAPPAPAPRKAKPVIAKLPHTGSNLPLVALLAFFALLGAAGLRFGRLASGFGR